MRILHLLNDLNRLGNGIVHAAVDLAAAQAAAGHDVAVASGGGPYEALLASAGVRHLRVARPGKGLALLHAAGELDAALLTHRPDVVHAHMKAWAALAWPFRPRHGFRLVTTVHNEFERAALLMGLGDRVIAVSDAVARRMVARGVPAGRVDTVLNGTVGSIRHQARVEPARLAGEAIVTVCGMYRRKGVSELLRAFARVAAERPEARLYLVGDGPDRAAFEAEAQALPCADRVAFLGFQEDPRSFMAGCAVFALASHREPFGLVLTEARELGCAIVASDVDGIPEALDDGEAGLLVPPRDVDALAAGLGQLLAEPGLARAFRRRAREGLDAVSVARMASETETVYWRALTAGLRSSEVLG
jgi:glycosyltransferase involved in cell wall biosynthesis